MSRACLMGDLLDTGLLRRSRSGVAACFSWSFRRHRKRAQWLPMVRMYGQEVLHGFRGLVEHGARKRGVPPGVQAASRVYRYASVAPRRLTLGVVRGLPVACIDRILKRRDRSVLISTNIYMGEGDQ